MQCVVQSRLLLQGISHKRKQRKEETYEQLIRHQYIPIKNRLYVSPDGTINFTIPSIQRRLYGFPGREAGGDVWFIDVGF
jgi:hypothetical protein